MCENRHLLFYPRITDYSVLVLSVDLRDAVGDRLYLSKGYHRDGVSAVLPCLILPDLRQTLFDIGQATALK